jgi:hypothetical protein
MQYPFACYWIIGIESSSNAAALQHGAAGAFGMNCPVSYWFNVDLSQ